MPIVKDGQVASPTVDTSPEAARSRKAVSRWWRSGLTLSVLTLWLLVGGLLLLFHLQQDEAHLFLGVLGSGHHIWVSYDTALYLDMIDQAQRGAWLFSNSFSPEVGSPRYLNSIWLVLGKLTGPLGLSAVTAFTLFRFAAILLFLIALRAMLARVIESEPTRRLAAFLIVFGGGIGWIFGILGQWQDRFSFFFLEGRKVEVACFLPLLISPHNVLAMALILWILGGLISCSQGSRRALWMTPVLVLLLTTFHPYDVVILAAVGAAYIAILWLRDGRLNKALAGTYIASLAAAAPVLAYHYWSLSTAPDLRGLFEQNNPPPPGAFRYLIATFPLSLLALHQLASRIGDFRRANNSELLVAAWALVIPVMLYSHPDISFSWKLTIGMFVPIGILAAMWIERWTRRTNGERARVLWKASPAIAALVVVSTLSSAIIVLGMLKAALTRSHPYYLTGDNVEALNWLDDQPGEDDVVLSGHFPGAFVPRFAHKRAFIGHLTQSVDFARRERFAQNLLADGSLSDAELASLKQHRVKWIYYGPMEHEWWPEVRPSSHLRHAYTAGSVMVYEVHYGDSRFPD